MASQTSFILSQSDTEKFIRWMRMAFEYGEETDSLVEILNTYFSTEEKFNLGVPYLKSLGIKALKNEDQQLIETTFRIKMKKKKNEEEKELMKARTRIFCSPLSA